MRKYALVLLLGLVMAFALAYKAHGQNKDSIDRLKQAETMIKLYEKTQKAISIIEQDRTKPVAMKVFDVKDLLEENRIKDYAPPSPFVFSVNNAGNEDFEDDEDYEEGFGPDELIELARSSTGDENWPEEAGGMGTIEYHRGKLIIVNTQEMVDKVELLLNDLQKSLPAIISSTVYLLVADEDYLQNYRRKDSSVITPQAIEKMLADAKTGDKIEIIKTGYISSYSSQAAFIHSGALHTYIGNTDTTGAGGMTPIMVFDPIINIFREGFIVGLRTQYIRETETVNVVAMVSLSSLTGIEEHTITCGGMGEQPAKTYKVETPKVDLQIVSGSSDIPEGYGLLLGGSKMKTAQSSQKSFLVLIVPAVLK